MPHLEAMKNILTHTLGLRRAELDAGTPLLGAMGELDSMAMVSLIAALEAHFGIAIADDDVHAHHFATLGSLTAFVRERTRT